MAQYYLICNMDKREYLSAEWFGLTSALPGMLRPDDGIMTGLGVLLTLSGSRSFSAGPLYGRWAGDRLAIIGDYYEGTVAGHALVQDDWGSIASQRDGWVDISEHVRQLLETDWEMTMRPPLLDGAEPRSLLHADGMITAVPGTDWDALACSEGPV